MNQYLPDWQPSKSRFFRLRLATKCRHLSVIGPLIHAPDDPFIPFEPLRDPVFTNNPYILLIDTERSGHVAFVSSRPNGEDRFWSENRVVEFCKLAQRLAD